MHMGVKTMQIWKVICCVWAVVFFQLDGGTREPAGV